MGMPTKLGCLYLSWYLDARSKFIKKKITIKNLSFYLEGNVFSIHQNLYNWNNPYLNNPN
jgi:hypothetical protein